MGPCTESHGVLPSFVQTLRTLFELSEDPKVTKDISGAWLKVEKRYKAQES